ncbi:hypothetical protein [Pseudomonas sp. CBC3]|uniref:hypothetical protein n=1 Tax=Pseudomonas sp. CBC3 TaxID=3123318 RepID=UPI0030E76BD3
MKFLDEAQATAQETSKLLAEGYNALDKLQAEGADKSFEEYLDGPEAEYDQFYRLWKQRIIENQFKLIRYFGKDLANSIIHLDEIDISPTDNLRSPDPCTPPDAKDAADINKIMGSVSCYSRFHSRLNHPLDKSKEESPDEFVSRLSRKGELDAHLRDLMDAFEVSYVSILRGMDNRFTQLGAQRLRIGAS